MFWIYILDFFLICRFNTKDSDGVVLNENRASCIMPWTEAENWVDFEVSLDGGPFYWKGMFFVEPPNVSPELVWFKDELVHTLGPSIFLPTNLKPQICSTDLLVLLRVRYFYRSNFTFLTV